MKAFVFKLYLNVSFSHGFEDDAADVFVSFVITCIYDHNDKTYSYYFLARIYTFQIIRLNCIIIPFDDLDVRKVKFDISTKRQNLLQKILPLALSMCSCQKIWDGHWQCFQHLSFHFPLQINNLYIPIKK